MLFIIEKKKHSDICDRSIPKLKKKAQTNKAKTIVGPIFCENQNKQSTVDV